MNKRKRRELRLAATLLGTFVLWTAAVCCIDVQPIGPQGSAVGLAALNQFARRLVGVNMPLYFITDWLSLIPLGLIVFFAVLGLAQWIGRRRLERVDRSILALGLFYAAVLAAYLLFETVPVNGRPVLIDGRLETSYPSSTTMLVLCVMPTSVMQVRARMNDRPLRRGIVVLMKGYTAFMVVGRLLSGVHWLSDIIGGALLSAGLVMLYRALGFGRAG